MLPADSAHVTRGSRDSRSSTSCCTPPGSSRRVAGQRPDVQHPVTGQLPPSELIGPVRPRLPPGPRPARGLPERTPAGLDYATLHGLATALAAVLERPGDPPPGHQLAAGCPRRRRRLEGAASRPRPPRRLTAAQQAVTRQSAPATPDPRPGVLPRHRPVGRWTTRPAGGSGRRPARSATQRDQHAQGTPPQGPDGPADPRAAARPARPGRRRRPAERGRRRPGSSAATRHAPGEVFTAGGQDPAPGPPRPTARTGPGPRTPPPASAAT